MSSAASDSAVRSASASAPSSISICTALGYSSAGNPVRRRSSASAFSSSRTSSAGRSSTARAARKSSGGISRLGGSIISACGYASEKRARHARLTCGPWVRNVCEKGTEGIKTGYLAAVG